MRLTMVLVCADPCLAHAHAHVRDAGRYDTTVGAAGDEWYYIFGSSSNVTVGRSQYSTHRLNEILLWLAAGPASRAVLCVCVCACLRGGLNGEGILAG